MVNKKKILVILACLIFIFSGCAGHDDCSETREESSIDASGDILIGAVASWEMEKEEHIWKGLEMALDEINSSGGIKGRKIKVIRKDDKGSLDKGLIIAKEFCTNTDIISVLGHSYSYISIPCSALYQYYGLPMISPTSDNPELSARTGYKYITQISPVTDNYVDKLVLYMKKAGLNKIVIFNQNDAFGKRFGDYFEKIASRNGLSTISRIPYSEAAPEIFFKNKLLACSYFYDFNALLVAGDAGSALPLIKLSSKYKIEVPVIGTEKFYTEKIVKAVTETGKRVIFPSAFNLHCQRERVRNFIEKFNKRYKTVPGAGAAQWYNAMIFLADAMRNSEKLTPSGIVNAMKKAEKWQGVLGQIQYDAKDYLKIVKDEIIIKTVDSDGEIKLADSKSIKDPGRRKR